MDTVIGKSGGGESVLLTFHFVKAELMLAFKREANTAKSVVDIINSLYASLGEELFLKLFPLIVVDNGSEFSNPSAIETAPDGAKRTMLFYTDPGAPYQKGACENNHSLIRRVIPKGTSLNEYSQKDINLLMNHVNSYTRKKLENRCPADAFSFFYGETVLEILGVTKVHPDDVILNSSLFKTKK